MTDVIGGGMIHKMSELKGVNRAAKLNVPVCGRAIGMSSRFF
jgi:hypothetical protein